jgi:uncharacterized protein YbcC (UPF0753/DUF2309 family)
MTTLMAERPVAAGIDLHRERLSLAIERACARIAPSWPLDQLIAVNPFWGWLDQPIEHTAAQLASRSGAQLLMSRDWFAAQYRAGRFTEAHLRRAIERAGAACTPHQLIELMHTPAPELPHRRLVTEIADAGRDVRHNMPWVEFVTHHLSQTCASYFDEGQAQLRPDHSAGLYASWRQHTAEDLSPRLLMGLAGGRERVRRLPGDARELIAQAVCALGVPEAEREHYFAGLLLSINGWAAWCAYLRWQARLGGGNDDHLVELLAMRLAWEWVLHDCGGDALRARWQAEMPRWPQADDAAAEARSRDWLLLDALELAYQDSLLPGLAQGTRRQPAHAPAVQAIFCIDVRSEVFRRALEAASPEVQTLGFAGFFGLFIEYQPLGAPAARPQLPGLFAPQLRAGDAQAPAGLAERRNERLQLGSAWKQFKTAPVSAFSFVEALGLFYAGKLAGDGAGWSRPVPQPEVAALSAYEQTLRKPRLLGPVAGGSLSAEQRADAAAVMLRAMSLTRDFARLVLLAGHGAQTTNNPFAAAYDCGACCGQTGEVNARAAAALLNDPEVRAGLAARGIAVPESTWFVAGLHNTTTDELLLYDLDELPASHRADLAQLQDWLAAAGARARAERAPLLKLDAGDDAQLLAAMQRRTRDWAQVRPEWGLANCAAFIVAPREHCKHLNLGGRSFLHDYRWRDDESLAILELIMTAPMVVTHWINMQYYASTVDNRRYGSGNKVLHNVVGGRIGVFEGNGGDLRIGLPMQALHDGERFMHEPLRLSVFIEAPRAAMDQVIAKHATVRQLVEHRWIHLFQIDDEEHAVYRRQPDGWQKLAQG